MKAARLLGQTLLLGSLFLTTGLAQQVRPIPYSTDTFMSPQYRQALEQGTRTLNGHPGATYWTNFATYTIEAQFYPKTATLTGEQTITYENRSPDNLERLYVNLRHNLYKEGTVRNRNAPLTGGFNLTKVTINGEILPDRSERRDAKGTSYIIRGTSMEIRLAQPLASGTQITLGFDWNLQIPPRTFRMGHDDEVYFIALWYPQMAVYDDVDGWDRDLYLGNGEHYMGYADYDVKITAPDGWLIGATGQLQNPTDVLSEQSYTRLQEAARSKATVNIVGENERQAGTSTRNSDSGQLTWHFVAENVRDFTFGTSDQYVWDATHATVGDRDGDGRDDTSMIHAFYRPDRVVWQRSAEFGQFSVEFLSQMFFPYPWPHMTTVEGIIGGGMEYPMITLIGGSRNDRSLFGVTFHEIGHMYFPMIVGQDEKRYTWMDEGLTSFNTSEAVNAFFPDANAWDPGRQSYYFIADSGNEVAPMRHGDQYPYGTPARGIASYNKPAVLLHALRGLYGQEKFLEAFRAYADRWAYKHPEPEDLFNTFEDVLGEDLDWFWTSNLYQTWTMDQAIANVSTTEQAVTVTVEDRGLSPMPILLRVTYANGLTEERKVPVGEWLQDKRQVTATFRAGKVVKVELDPEQYLPDVNRANNVWEDSGKD